MAYTVFEGTQPEAMDVEILGVLHNALGPGQDMIVARLTGPKPEYTGVVDGMSGSPVYIGGRLVGALAYRIGRFSKEPIAGITPIAEMLSVPRGAAPGGPEAAAATTGSAQSQASGSSGVDGLRASLSFPPPAGPQETSLAPGGQSGEVRPIETPLVFSGFSPEAVKLFGGRFRALGLTPMAGLGGSMLSGSGLSGSGLSGSALSTSGTTSAGQSRSGTVAAAQEDKAPLVPGSSVSALLAEGDLEIAATCTVTMIQAGQVLACGHPITQSGNVSLPMTKAEVVTTLASPMDSFKIINTAQTIGAFTEDRASAIRGTLGAQAQMIPVAIHVHGVGPPRTVHVRIVNNPVLTPNTLMVSVYQSLMQTNSYGQDLSYDIHGSVAISGYPAVKLDSFSAPTDQIPSAIRAALLVGQRFAKIYGNAARMRSIQSIDLAVDTLPGRRSMEIETAQATQPSARPGGTVMIEATLRPYRGQVRNLRIPIHLPATLPTGRLRILLSDGASIDRLTNSYPGVEPPTGLGSTIHQLNAAHADDVLYVSLLLPDPQAVVDGRTLPSIPLSMANILEPLRANREMSLNGESVDPVTSIPVGAMLSGQRVISLDIE